MSKLCDMCAAHISLQIAMRYPESPKVSRQVPGYVGLILVRCFCQAPQKAKISDKLSEKGKLILI